MIVTFIERSVLAKGHLKLTLLLLKSLILTGLQVGAKAPRVFYDNGLRT
jgi:hypothetical protein